MSVEIRNSHQCRIAELELLGTLQVADYHVDHVGLIYTSQLWLSLVLVTVL